MYKIEELQTAAKHLEHSFSKFASHHLNGCSLCNSAYSYIRIERVNFKIDLQVNHIKVNFQIIQKFSEQAIYSSETTIRKINKRKFYGFFFFNWKTIFFI